MGSMLRLALLAILTVACGTTIVEAPSTPAALSPLPPAPTSASPSSATSPSPSRVPGSVVRVTANGSEVLPGDPVPQRRGASNVVTLAFPFDMDRASVERFLPRDASPGWSDDRTLTLTLPEGSTGFKMVELASKDGRSLIDFLVVNLAPPQSVEVNVYTIADLTAGGAAGPTASAPRPAPSITHRITANNSRPPFIWGGTLSDDATAMLEYATPFAKVPYGVRVVDVATDTARDLPSPSAADGPFLAGQWLADGRLLIVGKKAWTINSDGTAPRTVADLTGPDGSPTTALLSPDRRMLALTWPGRVMVLDLTTGVLAALPTTFRPCDAATSVVLAWSLDAKRLAGSECPTGSRVDGWRVKIIDVPSGRIVATLPFGAYQLSTFATGELLAVTDSSISGEGAPSLGVVMGFDGIEHRRYLGGSWYLSPDTRYLLQREPTGGAGSSLGTFYTLIDQKASTQYRLFLPYDVRWLPDGRLAAL